MNGTGEGVIRTGIVGAGLMGGIHAATARRLGARVVAIADSNADAARALARRYPQSRIQSDVDALLGAGDLDVLHVCTPLATHVAIAEAALSAGVHVLIEKPMAATGSETEQLLALARKCNRIVCPVHQLPFQHKPSLFADLAAHSGELVAAEAVVCSAGAVGRSESEKTAIAADILPHPLSVLNAILAGGVGELEWRATTPGAGELRASAMAGRTSLSILISLSARPTEHSLLLRGHDGALHFDFFHGYCFDQPGTVSRAHKLARPFELGLRRLAAASANGVRRLAAGETAYPGLAVLIGEFYRRVRDQSMTAPVPESHSLAVARARDRILAAAALR